MLNSSAYPFIRELGFVSREFCHAIAEDSLTESSLIAKPCSFPPRTRTTFYVTVSNDGKYIASAHGDRSIYISCVITGKVLHRLVGHPRSPWTLAFHPSRSDLLVSGCLGGEVRVWDLTNCCSEVFRIDEKPLEEPASSSSPNVSTAVGIASVAFHPELRLVVIAAGDRLIFWDWFHKLPMTECRTASPVERVRYAKFDRTGTILFTGVANAHHYLKPPGVPPVASRNTMRSTFRSSTRDRSPGRRHLSPASVDELLDMREELSRRRSQLLQHLNDLRNRYQELRRRYANIRACQRWENRLATWRWSPNAALSRSCYNENAGTLSERFDRLLEESRQVLLHHSGIEAVNSDDIGSASTNAARAASPLPQSPMSPAPQEPAGLHSVQQLMEQSSHDSANQGASTQTSTEVPSRVMMESAQYLVRGIQSVCDEYVQMQEEVQRMSGNMELPLSQRYDPGRTVLSVLAEVHTMMRSGNPGIEFRPSSNTNDADGNDSSRNDLQGNRQRQICERILREARILKQIHDLLLDLRIRLEFPASIVRDLQYGADRLSRLIADLNELRPRDDIHVLQQRLLTEILYFKEFISQWKQMVTSNLAANNVSNDNSQASTSADINGNSSFIRLSLSPDNTTAGPSGVDASSSLSSGEQSTVGGALRSQNENMDQAATISKRVGNVVLSPMRDRLSHSESVSSNHVRINEQGTSSVQQVTVNLSPSRATASENPGVLGGTVYHYVCPSINDQGGLANSSSAATSSAATFENSVTHSKRRRLNFTSFPLDSSTSSAAEPRAEAGPNDQQSDNVEEQYGSPTSPQTDDSPRTATNRHRIPSRRLRDRRLLSTMMQLFPRPQRHRWLLIRVPMESPASQNRLRIGTPPRVEHLWPSIDPWLRTMHRDIDGAPSEHNARRVTVMPSNREDNDEDDWEYSYDLNRAVNRAIAGAFVSTGDMALANNIMDVTCRIQRWPISLVNGAVPDLSKVNENVVVSKCKLYNDGSISVNQDGTLLAAFVENSSPDRSILAHTTLQIISLRKEDLGTLLFEKQFGPNAISVCFSPAGHHVLVGLASRRYLRLRHSPQTCAHIFALHNDNSQSDSLVDLGDAKTKPRELKLVMNVEHAQTTNETGAQASEEIGNWSTWSLRVDSLNCASWLPTPGHGLCYGTNRGQVFVLTPKRTDSNKEESTTGQPIPIIVSDLALLRTLPSNEQQLAGMDYGNGELLTDGGEVLAGNGNLMA